MSYKGANKKPLSKSRPYTIWRLMKERCNRQKCRIYPYYGGRGIKYCSKWETFAGFWEDMEQGYHSSLTLERIDNDGDYEINNCRWATIKEQCNNRRSNTVVTLNGESRNMVYWIEKSGIKQTTVYQRLRYGWTIEKALGMGG